MIWAGISIGLALSAIMIFAWTIIRDCRKHTKEAAARELVRQIDRQATTQAHRIAQSYLEDHLRGSHESKEKK